MSDSISTELTQESDSSNRFRATRLAYGYSKPPEATKGEDDVVRVRLLTSDSALQNPPVVRRSNLGRRPSSAQRHQCLPQLQPTQDRRLLVRKP